MATATTTATTHSGDVIVSCANCGHSGPMPKWLADDFDGKCPRCKLSHAVSIEAAVDTFDAAESQNSDSETGGNWPPAEPRDDEYFQTKDGAHGRAAASNDGASDACEILQAGDEAAVQTNVASPVPAAGEVSAPAELPDDGASSDAPSFSRPPRPTVSKTTVGQAAPAPGMPGVAPSFPRVSGDLSALTPVCPVVVVAADASTSRDACVPSSAHASRQGQITLDNLDRPSAADLHTLRVRTLGWIFDARLASLRPFSTPQTELHR